MAQTPKPTSTGSSTLLDRYKAGASLSLQEQELARQGMTPAQRYAVALQRGNAITAAQDAASPTPTPKPKPPVATPTPTPITPTGAPTPSAAPSAASGSVPGPSPTPTVKTGGYGTVDPGNAYANGSLTDTVPFNVKGKTIRVPISEAIKFGQGGSAGLQQVIDALRAKGQISKSTNNITTISDAWSKTVLNAMRLNQNPFDYLNTLPAPVEGATKADGSTTYVTDYSGSKGQSAFQSAFNNIFGRNPVAGDELSPMKDAKGNPITWIQALNNEAQKPGNAETVTRTGNGTYVVTKGGFDAQAWMQGQLTDYYRKGITAGTLQPEQNVQTQYSTLAHDYGINIYDPSNKGFNTSARLDLANLEAKTTTLDALKQQWAGASVAKYGHLAPQLIQSGLTLRQVADPALKSISNILGIDPNTVALDDPLVQKYLAGDGKSVMPQYQYEQTLRQDPRWNTSKDAQDNLSSVAMSLAKTFGVMG